MLFIRRSKESVTDPLINGINRATTWMARQTLSSYQAKHLEKYQMIENLQQCRKSGGGGGGYLFELCFNLAQTFITYNTS